MMSQRGVTLIEMLIVIGIIAVLIGLLLPVAGMVRERAHWLDAANRVELVRRALSAVEPEEGSAAIALMRRASLPGVTQTSYQRHHADPAQRDRLAAAEGAWLAYDLPWQLRFPLGRSAVGFTSTNPYQSTGPGTGSGGNWQFVKSTTYAGIPFTLAEMTSAFTPALLVAAGICPDADAYRQDRGPTRPWNDPWGQPLIIGLGLYQYGPITADARSRWPWTEVGTTGEQDLTSPAFAKQWSEVRTHYGVLRTLYLAVGAIGPEGPVGLASSLTDANIDACWQQILTLCNTADDGSELWRMAPSASPPVDALAHPPWQGLRQRKLGSKQSLLALPLVVE